MKILSKRHPDRQSLVVVDELPFTGLRWIPQVRHVHMPVQPRTHITVQRKSGLDFIDVPKLIETVQSNCEYLDGTKITDFGGGDFTIEMWVKLPAAVREIDLSASINDCITGNVASYMNGEQL